MLSFCRGVRMRVPSLSCIFSSEPSPPPSMTPSSSVEQPRLPCLPSAELPSEPGEGECCGQGCAQCVWIVYGERVVKHARLLPANHLKEILTANIKDPALRAFVLAELGIR